MQQQEERKEFIEANTTKADNRNKVWLVQKIEHKDKDVLRKIKSKITGSVQKKAIAKYSCSV